MSPPLLDVQDLSVRFRTRDGIVHALDRVGFSIERRESLALVGESGSGKSVSAFAVMGLLGPAAEVTAARIALDGTDLTGGDPAALRHVRGARVAMVFQNARAALNPIRTIGRQLMDVIKRHHGATGPAARTAALDALAQVRIPDPKGRFDAYPFEISGGMCQRVMIAIALACQPELLIADEPTTGLDVTTQAAIMDLIDALAEERGMATLLITHDLGLARDHCSRIAVMHAGHIVETGQTETLFAAPAHPYTAGLIAATPTEVSSLAALSPIQGGLPDLRHALPPCRFSARCARKTGICGEAPLPSRALSEGHIVACHHPTSVAKKRALA
ncbi:MAG: ABC transporter ATP-binding protein [Pseudomonadota bacterium]